MNTIVLIKTKHDKWQWSVFCNGEAWLHTGIKKTREKAFEEIKKCVTDEDGSYCNILKEYHWDEVNEMHNLITLCILHNCIEPDIIYPPHYDTPLDEEIRNILNE